MWLLKVVYFVVSTRIHNRLLTVEQSTVQMLSQNPFAIISYPAHLFKPLMASSEVDELEGQ